MSSLPYASLSESQRAQVAYLFADHIFGTDVNAFVYEVDGERVKGRVKSVNSEQSSVSRRARQNARVVVTMVEEAYITNEMIAHAQMSMDALAASIAQRLNQSIPQEVNAS